MELAVMEEAIKLMYRNYTDQDIIQFVQESSTLAEVLRKLGLKAVGGNYQTLKKNILRLDIDTSHMSGMNWRKGLRYEDITNYKSKTFLRRRLLETRGNICENCGISEWLGEELSLELHHIDGNSLNGEEENLILLCPNCHSLTESWRKRNYEGVSELAAGG